MNGLNKVMLMGNLGKDPEVQYLERNVAVAKFSVATTESYKDKEGNWVDQTDWHNVVLWRWLAEKAEKFLKKGSRVYIEGKIKTRSYDDREGNKKYITEIVGDKLILLDRREDSQPGGSTYAPAASQGVQTDGQNEANPTGVTPQGSFAEEGDDDLPF